jgi:hypothetical protein
MESSLAKRVEELEEKVVELSRVVHSLSSNAKDWRSTLGWSKGDPDFDEMIRFGREYRESLRTQDGTANS